MKAAILYGREHLKVEEIPEKPLESGEVRVQIEAALTCGTDLKVYRRGYHARMLTPPCLFGHEWAGLISEIHDDVADWKVGDRVVGANSAPCGVCMWCNRGQENLCADLQFLNGAYADSIVVPSRLVMKNLLPIRPGTPFHAAALTEPLACVVQGMADLGPVQGEHLLVLGSGPIGLMAAAIGIHQGCRVTLAGRGEGRLGLAKRLGVEQIIDMKGREDLESAIRESALESTFDSVFEAVGKPGAWEAAIRLVRRGGHINFFGGCPGGTVVSLDTTLIHYSALRLMASFHHTPDTIRRALSLIETGVIRSDDFIDDEVPLSQLPLLFQKMALGNRAVKTRIRPRA